jgi:hypothetical protein
MQGSTVPGLLSLFHGLRHDEPIAAHQTFVTQLLQYYHRGKPEDAAHYELPTPDQVNFLCDVGLGPIAFRVYGDDLRGSDPALFSVLQGADLTTRAIYGQLERAAVDLLSRLRDLGVIPTLLKGISTAHQFYAPPHLRVMADIDLLVEGPQVELVMAEIADLGYEIADQQWRLYHVFGHHHLPAARHPASGATIEVHTGLFGSEEFYSREAVFQPESFSTQITAFDYRGIRVARFTPEFQFIFTVSKWSVGDDWAINLTGINDAIHILTKYESKFDWPTMSRWISANPHLVPIITALMHYLEQAGIVTISPEFRQVLSSADPTLGKRTLQLLLRLLHAYPFNADSKVYGGYARWRAHALWLYLSKPDTRDSRLPIAIFRAMLRSASYGRHNPVIAAPFRLFMTLLHQVRRKFFARDKAGNN